MLFKKDPFRHLVQWLSRIAVRKMAAMKKCSARSMVSAGVLMRTAMKSLALGVAVQLDVQERVSSEIMAAYI